MPKAILQISVFDDLSVKSTPIVEPSPQPQPQPQPQPEPAPVPVPGNAPSPSPSGGIPYPSLYSPNATPGQDLSKLKADTTLPPGEYIASGSITKNVVAMQPGSVTLRLGGGQTPYLPDVFAGIVVRGGGLPDNDDLTKSGTRAGELVHTCSFLDSEGYGLLVNVDGARIIGSIISDNGSGGIGGTGASDVLVKSCRILRNNLKYGRTNSGGGKWTRIFATYDDCDFSGNGGGDAWGDNYCEMLRFLKCRFVGGPTDKSGDPWKRNNIRGEISKHLEVIGCDFTNDAWAAICVNEVRDGFKIIGNTFRGKSKKAIEFRDLARSGYELGSGLVDSNVFESDDLMLVHSGAGNDIAIAKEGIVISATNRWPDGKVTSHIQSKLN